MEKATIYRNKRKGPDDFSMEHFCDFCDKYVNQVIRIPRTFLKINESLICRNCLLELVKQLDENMKNNFQSDFEEERNKFYSLKKAVSMMNLSTEVDIQKRMMNLSTEIETQKCQIFKSSTYS